MKGMSQQNRKIESVSTDESQDSAKPRKREYVDPLQSERKGFGGFVETSMRKFKRFTHLVMILPIYAITCCILGLAIGPGIAMFQWVSSFGESGPAWLRYFATGTGAAMGYFTYGFSLIVVLPIVNMCFQTKLKPWRGPYYSLEAIRWYIHNGITYLARYTILEFITPTPFNHFFYRMMGMKMGHGVTINSTWISDPSLIELGDKVTIGGSVTLIGHYGQGGYLVLAKTVIGSGATVGLKATVMGGVTIGENARVLPNSVVLPKTVIPDGETWGGVPAKKIEV